jgi:hypothetical protein
MASSVYSDKDYMLDRVVDSAYSSDAEHDVQKEEPLAAPFSVEQPELDPEPEARPTLKRKRSMDLGDAMYQEALYEEKSRVLARLMRLKVKGTVLSRNFSMADSIEDMNRELNIINRIRGLNSGVTKGKGMVLGTAWCVEGLAKKQSFIDLKLDGWFNHVLSEIDQYDPILTEIYQEYFSEIQMNPIMSLGLALGTSAFAYSTGMRARGAPPPTTATAPAESYEDILKQDEELVRKGVAKKVRTAKTADSSAPRFTFV